MNISIEAGNKKNMHLKWQFVGPTQRWVNLALRVAYLFAILGFFAAGDSLNMIQAGGGWTPFTRLPFFSSLDIYSPAPGGSVWLIVEPSLFQGTSELRRVGGAASTTMSLPVPGYIFAQSIATDPFGRPWMALDDGSDGLTFWDGTHWQKFQAPQPESYIEKAYATGQYIVALSNTPTDTHQLIAIDPSTLSSRLLPIPSLAANTGFQLQGIQPTNTGQLLVLTSGEQGVLFFMLKGDQWQAESIYLNLPANIIADNYTMDSLGNLWVLISNCNWDRCEQHRIGKFDRQTQHWQWNILPCDLCTDLRYRSLVVDSKQRIWVETHDQIIVGQYGWGYRDYVDVFEFTSEDVARQLVRYSNDNSNYERTFRTGLQIGSDGRLWAGDRTLLTIDPTQPLPTPYPDWLAALVSSPAKWIFWAPLTIIVAIIWHIALAYSKRNRATVQ